VDNSILVRLLERVDVADLFSDIGEVAVRFLKPASFWDEQQTNLEANFRGRQLQTNKLLLQFVVHQVNIVYNRVARGTQRDILILGTKGN